MEKARQRLLVAITSLTAAFLIFIGGFFLGRQQVNNGYVVITEHRSPAAFSTESLSAQLPDGNALININEASAEELETLNGIGPGLAAAIIEYRESVGGFDYTFELLDVSGIGEKIYERIKNNITVNEVT